MRRNLITAILYTLITTVIFGLAYPFVVTGIAQVFFKDKANGQLLQRNGQLIGSRIIGQPFTAAGYFHSRPSAAGNGYDAANSSGSNYAPTNKKLIDRVAGDVSALQVDHPTPTFQSTSSPRIARERRLSEDAVRRLVVSQHTQGRQLGFLGEPRVNVLELNLALDETAPLPAGK